MGNEKHKVESSKRLLARVAKATAEPRLTLSVRSYFRSHPMINDAKFCNGAVVHNSVTREYGQIKCSYKKNSLVMYEVNVPVEPNTWIKGSYSSDWEESRLELSSREQLWGAR